MKFHETKGIWDDPHYLNEHSTYMSAYTRGLWIREMRPYYKCWPSVITPLLRLRLDVDLQSLDLKPRILAIRMPIGQEVRSGDICLRWMLTAYSRWSDTNSFSIEHFPTASGTALGSGIYWIRLADNGTIEEVLQSQAKEDVAMCGVDVVGPFLAEITKLALSVHLLANDPEIIEPDVLSKDELAYERTKDQKYVDKAHRRGKIGWHIGKTFESIPHYRRPHPALFHTGKGRMVPRIVFRSGCVVHRDRLTKVPTGYITPDGVEVEP